METPVSLLVYAYNEEGLADEVLMLLKELERQGSFRVLNAAVLTRSTEGILGLKETEDVGAGRGALFGAITGGLIGLIGGPVGAVVGAAAGAAAGGVAAHNIDMGFSNEHLKDIQETLKPGSSAIIALVEHQWVERVADELARHEGTLFRRALKADIAEQLAAAGDEEAKESG